MAKSARSRRGRGIVIGAILALLAVQLGMVSGIDGKRLYWADAEYGTTVRNLSARKSEFPDRPIVLNLGTSRGQAGLAADRLSEAQLDDENPPLVLNSCLGGAHPIHQLLMLRRLIAIGVKPSAVLIEILPVFLRELPSQADSATPNRTLPLNPETEGHRLRPADFDLVWKYDRDRTPMWAQRYFESHVAPWYTHRYTLTGRYAETWAPKENVTGLNNWKTAISPYGWNRIGLQTVPDEVRIPALKVAEGAYRPYLDFHGVNPFFRELLTDILELCRAEGIDALGLLLMPEGSEFRSWYPESTKRLIREHLGAIAAEHNTRVIDANTWIPDEHFVDGHHLIEPGALILSRRIRREVIQPWAKGRQP